MDQAREIAVPAESAYTSCTFCSARCFKLHGAGMRGSNGYGSRPVKDEGLGLARTRVAHRTPSFVKTVRPTTVMRRNCELVYLSQLFFVT